MKINFKKSRKKIIRNIYVNKNTIMYKLIKKNGKTHYFEYDRHLFRVTYKNIVDIKLWG